MEPLLNIAIPAARAAGKLIVSHLDRLDALSVTRKSFNELVSEVDRQAEQSIVQAIRRIYPGHGILGEEGGQQGDDEYTWIIDPLDGTTNFLHGFPQFSVSIGITRHGRLEHGVIYDPLRAEIFSASRGRGALLNDKRIRVSRCNRLEHALLGTGFPYRRLGRIEPYLAILRELFGQTEGVRRAGSAALDLAYVAAGRLDGFWEFDLQSWDMAAGALLIQEAGGIVTEPDGGTDYLKSGDIVAGNPKVLKALLRIIHPHLANTAVADNTADNGPAPRKTATKKRPAKNARTARKKKVPAAASQGSKLYTKSKSTQPAPEEAAPSVWKSSKTDA